MLHIHLMRNWNSLSDEAMENEETRRLRPGLHQQPPLPPVSDGQLANGIRYVRF